MALSHYLLLAELTEKAKPAPEPYVIEVGESEYEKAERKREEAEKREKAAAESKLRHRSTNAGSGGTSADRGWLRFEATAYTAFCNTGCSGITKSGLDVSNTTQHVGRTIIAVDPAVIPLGSKVSIRLADGRVIEGIAEDTGGDIRGKRIDVLVGSEGQAREFGRQSVQIKVMGAE